VLKTLVVGGSGDSFAVKPHSLGREETPPEYLFRHFSMPDMLLDVTGKVSLSEGCVLCS
jgi:hypothetical protein